MTFFIFSKRATIFGSQNRISLKIKKANDEPEFLKYELSFHFAILILYRLIYQKQSLQSGVFSSLILK